MSFYIAVTALINLEAGNLGTTHEKKIGKVFTICQERFQAVWTQQHRILIDEGTILFKGNIHFKAFNPMKPDKYGIKTYNVLQQTVIV